MEHIIVERQEGATVVTIHQEDIKTAMKEVVTEEDHLMMTGMINITIIKRIKQAMGVEAVHLTIKGITGVRVHYQLVKFQLVT